MSCISRSILLRTFAVLLFVQFAAETAHSQTFTGVGGLPTPLAGQTATTLPNGSVLVAGGTTSNLGNASANAYIYNPQTQAYSQTGSMTVARSGHTATLLGNGQVLIANGCGTNCAGELYNPATQSFTKTGTPVMARYGGTATLLQNGEVLFTGGNAYPGTNSAELYNPSTGTFTATGSMAYERTYHTATLLQDGSVLVAGGSGVYNGYDNVTATAERYNPVSGTFSAVGNMATARLSHTATLLPSGNVLIAGGFDTGICCTATSAAEVYSFANESFSATGSLNAARAQHAATALEDGTILIAGGLNQNDTATLNSAEIYTPSSGSFSTTANMTTASFGPTAVLLTNGQVLISGGGTGGGPTASSEVYTYPFTGGNMSPKYIVLGIMYAPPGSKSSVSYTQTQAVGASSQFTNSFSSGTTVSTSLGISGSFGSKGVAFTGSGTFTNSTGYTVEADSLSTYTVNKTIGSVLGISGPLSNIIGVDHDYDTFIVWLNPQINMSVSALATNLLWNGYTFNLADPYSNANTPDIIYLTLFCLKNPFLNPNCTTDNARASRSWDTSGVGGLTLADYQTIAQRDPFYKTPQYDPDSDPLYRFTPTGQVAEYPLPSPEGGQYFGSGNYNYSIASTDGQGATDSYQVSTGIDISLKDIIGLEFKDTNTLSLQTKWSLTQNFTAGQTAQWTIYGPLATDNYPTGSPTSFDVYQDNVYGTFMFYAPGYGPSSPGSIGVSPTAVDFGTVAGGSTSSPVQLTLTNESTMPMYMGVASAYPFTGQGVTENSPVAAFSSPSFSVVSGMDTCSGHVISSNGTCALSIQFSPSTGSNGPIGGTVYLTGETDAVVLTTVSVSGASGDVLIPAPGNINTIAGGSTQGYGGDGGAGTSAELYSPSGVAVDSGGNVYIADTANCVIRKVAASTGIISTYAGNHTCGYAGDGGSATSAELASPYNLALDGSGNLYIADTNNNVIREVTASTGFIHTIAGTGPSNGGYAGNGGLATSAKLSAPSGVAIDPSGDVYIADGGNCVVREVTASNGIINTVAGNGTCGYSGDAGQATSAKLWVVSDVALDSNGNLYIASFDRTRSGCCRWIISQSRIREVTSSTGIINTIAGTATSGYTGNGGPATSAELGEPWGLAVDSTGNVYIGDSSAAAVREIVASTGIINTVAGNGSSGYSGDGGQATGAELNFPAGVAVDVAGNIYVADESNNRVRAVGAP